MREEEAKEVAKGMIGDYLRMIGIDAGPESGPGKNFRCLNPRHTDENPSMGLDRRRSKVHCFSCGASYDVFDLVGIEYGLSGKRMFAKTYDLLGLDIGSDSNPAPKAAPATEAAEEGKDCADYFAACSKRLRETNYASMRGISEEVASRFNLGYDPRFGKDGWKALIIPTGPGSFVARNTDPECEDHDRYRKIGKSEIFNAESLHGSDRPVFVTEGEIDALSVMSAGGEAVALGSVSNAGKLLRLVGENPPAAPLILALDNDKRGNEAADKLAQGLSRIGAKALPINPYGESKDANAALMAASNTLKANIANAELKAITAFHAEPHPNNGILSDNIDIMGAYKSEKKEADFIWHGFLAGTVGALVAPGATGKSFWALEAAMAVACGTSGGDLLQLGPKRSGRVLVLAGEDPKDQIIDRIRDIGIFQTSQAQREIAQNLTIKCTMGKMLNLMDDSHRQSLITAGEGMRLIVLDTLSRIHMLDENSNGDMGKLLSVLENISAATGAAILYLHHVSKGSARGSQGESQQAARGASALIDNARWCGFLSKMSESEAQCLREDQSQMAIGDNKSLFVKYGISKQNYGATPQEQWYKHSDCGVLMPVRLVKIPRCPPFELKSPRRSADALV